MGNALIKRPRGRPKGSKTKRFREIALRLAAYDATPVQVLMENMHYAHFEAQGVLERIKGALPDPALPKDGTQDKPGQQGDLSQIVDWNKEMQRMREFAVDCATRAAPYIHPRLAATVPPPPEEDMRQIEGRAEPVMDEDIAASVAETVAFWTRKV